MNKLSSITLIAIAIAASNALGNPAVRDLCQEKHFGVIGAHYGILTDEDLKRSDEGSYPATQFDGSNFDYPYWQCFDKKYLKFHCSYQKPLDKQGSSLSIEVETKFERHSYSHPHAISGEVCKQLLSEMGSILNKQTYFCINGTNDSNRLRSGKKEFDWTFYRLKTTSGYVHYLQP